MLAQAKEVLLLAFGENKTNAVAQAVEGPVTPAVPASFLQEHPNATFYLDAAASAGMKTPSQSEYAHASRLVHLMQRAHHLLEGCLISALIISESSNIYLTQPRIHCLSTAKRFQERCLSTLMQA